MKKFFLLFILTLLVAACGNKNAFTLKGTIEGLPSDTILVFYQQPDYKLDTLIARQGKFSYIINPDTFTIFSLLLDEEHALPIYADKGEKVTLSGTPDKIQIKGKGENETLAKILPYLQSLQGDKMSLRAATDSIIRANPHSFTNIYLIDKYYAQDSVPDYEQITELIKGLSGIIKDTPYIIDLQTKLEERPALLSNRTVSSISCPDKNGKTINWSQVKDKYILLDFWASWDKESVTAQDSLVPVQKALKKEKFTIISLSLDLDRKDWLAVASQRDTTQWKQVCDFKGWDSPIVKQQGITQIPSNLLIGPNKRVIAQDIRGKELIDKVKELIKQDKEKEKAAKEAERARKRQNRK